MLGIPYLTKKVAVTAVALIAAGGATAAAVIPAVAAPSSTSAPSTAPARPHSGTKTAPDRLHGHRIASTLVRATAKETGLSVKTVLQDLAAGQTLNQIAGGKASAVENDVLTGMQKRLDRAVDRNKITKQQEADLLAKAKTRIEQLMGENLSKAFHRTSPAPSTKPGTATATSV